PSPRSRSPTRPVAHPASRNTLNGRSTPDTPRLNEAPPFASSLMKSDPRRFPRSGARRRAMVRWWGGVVWALVGAAAAAVAIETLLVRDAAGGLEANAAQAATGLRLNEILAGPARDWDGDGVYDSKADEGNE